MHILMLCADCYMIDRRVLQQAQTLMQAGHRVTLLSGFECQEDQDYVDDGLDIHRYAYRFEFPVVDYIRSLLPRGDRPTAFAKRAINSLRIRMGVETSFDKFVWRRAKHYRADVVHVHDLDMLRHGLKAAKAWDVPLVFDAHEIYYEEDELDLRTRRWLEQDEKRGLPQVDLFITVNHLIADYYENKYARRPLVLLNAPYRPKPGFDSRSRELLRERAGLGPTAKVALFQGWFSEERNLFNLMKAVKYFPDDAYLALIGYGEFEVQMRELWETLPWRDRIRFLGEVEFDDLLELTAGADVGVIPYLPTCLNSILCSPNKFFEFTNAGVPFVSHRLPFFEEVGGKHGIVLTGDFTSPEGFALPLVTLLRNDALRNQMHDNAVKASEELCWQVEGEKLLAAYEPVLAKARVHAGHGQG